MKKILLIIAFCACVFACQTAENKTVETKNTNANYNQNSELQKIRNQLKQQSSNTRNLNSAENQTENVNPESENLSNQNANKKVDEKHENLHQIEPERQR